MDHSNANINVAVIQRDLWGDFWIEQLLATIQYF